MNKIGSLFLSASHYADEANQTIGQAGLSEQVFTNRRNVSSRLTPAGQAVLEETKKYFSWYGVKVSLRWSIYAGCTMCPCSPGFNIMVISDKFLPSPWARRGDRREARMWNIWGEENGTLDIREPREFPIKLPVTIQGLA